MGAKKGNKYAQKNPSKWFKFAGSEKEFGNFIEKDIKSIFKSITGSDLSLYTREYILSGFKDTDYRGLSVGRADFFVTDNNNKKYIIEIKTPQNIYEQSHGVTQLLVYKSIYEKLNKEQITPILISNEKDDIIPFIVENYFLPIKYSVVYADGNIEVMSKRPVGRPPKFPSLSYLEGLIEDYFRSRAEAKLPFTITGLALHLGTSREGLLNYQETDEFFDTIKRAKSMCEDYSEIQLFNGKNQAGAIFSLKNFGWRDKTESDIKISAPKPITELFTNGVQDSQQHTEDSLFTKKD